jgi:hypothetical protein
MQEHDEHSNAHGMSGEQIVGVTRDPILRPAGALLVMIGAIWALFWGMAVDAGTLGQPLAAATLIVLGVLALGAGKPAEQV